MKLRIHTNSIRLRVTRTDLKRLIGTGRIAETVILGVAAEANLTYALEWAHMPQPITMVYRPREIAVVVSSEAAREWADQPRQVGIYGRVAVAGGELELIVEKDFACLNGEAAENLDTFPNPKSGAAC